MLQTRYLQWQQAQQATESLLRTRANAMERYTYYMRLLGQPLPGSATAPFTVDHAQLPLDDTLEEGAFESSFQSTVQTLIGQYDQNVPVSPFAPLVLAGSASASNQSGATGQGNLYLNVNEDSELNSLLPTARDTHLAASIVETLAPALGFIPDFTVNLAYWGVGMTSKVFGGSTLAEALKSGAEILRTVASYEQEQAGITSKTASYQRRADEWLLQSNLAARELMQNGRQVVGSLIAEQTAHNEYQTAQTQVTNAQEVNSFLMGQAVNDAAGNTYAKFTTGALYQWMQGELSSLYYQYYRLAVDTARKAERAMKQELMRPEVDAMTFIQPNYWDSGRQGLLSGEALAFDVKRMEAAYLDNNAREFELTRHVSLRRLDPLALITLRVTGKCQISVPEWLYDLDGPGHYMRRLKTVALSIPSVVGPYQSVNCTLTLLTSTVRRGPDPRNRNGTYARDTTNPDDRFVDYPGTGQQIVTSSGNSDGGLFEPNLRDERFLPFEGAGAVSTWRLELPDHASFDYASISDAVLHVRYTARQGGDPLRAQVTKELDDLLGAKAPAGPGLFLLLSMRHDFPSEWAARQWAAASGNSISLTFSKAMFPYLVQNAKRLTVGVPVLYKGRDAAVVHAVASAPPAVDFGQDASVTVTVTDGGSIMTSDAADVFMLVPYAAQL
jgi:hypothetical protein